MKAKKSKNRDLSYVYIIGDKKNDVYKIGKADNVSQRLHHLKAGNPFLVVIHQFEFKSSRIALKVEADLHKRFFKERFYREWFRFTETQLREFSMLVPEIEKIIIEQETIPELIPHKTVYKSPGVVDGAHYYNLWQKRLKEWSKSTSAKQSPS